MKRKGFIREFHEIKIYTMFNNFPFLKQNRVTKRLALLASDRIVTVKKELKKDTDEEKLNNNAEPVKEVVTSLPKTQDAQDPFQLLIPGDYDDYWYFGEDGEWYNEYDDELEEGYYYQKEKKLPAWCTDTSNALPKPSDYEDYWYEGEDGQWYNEYDDELDEGQYYADKTDDTAEADKQKEQERVEKEKREAAEAKRVENVHRPAFHLYPTHSPQCSGDRANTFFFVLLKRIDFVAM